MKNLLTKLKNFKYKKVLYVAIPLLILFLLAILFPGEPEEQVGLEPQFTSTFSDLAKNTGVFSKKDEFVVDDGAAYITTFDEPTPEEIAAKKVVAQLPIYNDNFQTSVGMTTIINIFVLPSDPPDTIHLEIYGLGYGNKDVDGEKNPQVIAFKESFAWAVDELAKIDVSLNDMNVIYSNREYIADTINYWIQTFDLL